MDKSLNALFKISPICWVKFLIYCLLLSGMYYSAFSWLILKDWQRDGYSYGPLIPVVVLYLFWIKRDDLSSKPSVPTSKGLAPLSLGLLFYWIGELGGEYLTLYISFWLVLVGIVWIHLGWKRLKTVGFALFFMLTMFPPPDFLNTKLMLKLRLISSELGVGIIQWYGLPVHRQGNIIDLGFTQLQVVEACSGLHSLISLFVLCLLLIYFLKGHWWKRLVLLVSSIPLAIITNSMRIALTAILFSYFGEDVAQGFFHGFSGLLIFAFCIPVLFIEMKILEKLPPQESITLSSSDGFNKDNSKLMEYKVKYKGSVAKSRGIIRKPLFLISVFLLGTTLALSNLVDFREKIPVKRSLALFPLKIGEWSADKRVPLAQMFIDRLDLTEYVMADYINSAGKIVNFYVAYYESQSKGKSIHSPATCLPGSGWDFRQSGAVAISDHSFNNVSMLVNRAIMQQGNQYQLSYFWFPQRGRILTNAYQLKLYGFWDSLTKQRTDGALVRLVTRVYKDEKIDGADERLRKFVRDILPVLDEYIPGKEI